MASAFIHQLMNISHHYLFRKRGVMMLRGFSKKLSRLTDAPEFLDKTILKILNPSFSNFYYSWQL